MEKRQIGRSSLTVAPLAFGANVFGWTLNEKESFRVLDAFVAAGFNLVDTADAYPRWATGVGGESETIIGNWMKARNNRHQVVLATKVGNDMGKGPGLGRDYILAAVEDSLKRLGTDYIDLYQSHKDDLNTPVEETLEAYNQLVKAGKVRVTGASNFSPARLTESLMASERNGWPRYECLQPHYNLCVRDVFEAELEKICLDEQLGVISYYSLASGFLTGKYRSEADLLKSVRGAGAGKYLNAKGHRILEGLDAVSAKHKVTPATVAIAWLLHRPVITAPIASATSTQQLAELVAAVSLQLDAKDMDLLNTVSDWH